MGVPDRPLQLTMWDWSWFSHHSPGEAFADWPRVLAEAAERGFDTVRFDPLCDLVAHTSAGEAELEVVAGPSPIPWLHVPQPRRVSPLREVVEFATAAAAAGMRLILSTWGLGRGRRGSTVEFARYPNFTPFDDDARALDELLTGWDRVLAALGAAGLLDRVAYVDLNNELDLVIALASAQVRAATSATPAVSWSDWSARHGQVLREFAENGISWLHQHYPQLAATASCCGPVELIGDFYPRNADVLEWHVWGAGGAQWDERLAALLDGTAGIGPAAFATPASRQRLDAAFQVTYQGARGALHARVERELRAVRDRARVLGLPAVLGEGYAYSWYSDAPEMSWEWIREISALGTRTAQRLGFAGYTTSNFSEPTFPLWAERSWHVELLAGSGDPLVPPG